MKPILVFISILLLGGCHGTEKTNELEQSIHQQSILVAELAASTTILCYLSSTTEKEKRQCHDFATETYNQFETEEEREAFSTALKQFNVRVHGAYKI